MTRIPVKITLQSPVLLAKSPPASNLIESLPFIPGNTLRGVLARRYLDHKGKPEDTLFRMLFLDGPVRFGCVRRDWSVPVPLSARSCKYVGGFAAEKADNHGVLDLLLDPTDNERTCPRCNHTIDYVHGFYDPRQYQSVPIQTHLITRTAIDPHRGTASTGKLFSQRVLSEGQEFFATIETPDDYATPILDLVAEPFIARMGTGSSRGQGWVEVRHDEEMPLNWGLARARFPHFLYKPTTADTTARPALAVTFLSDGLFHDAYLRDTTAPTLEDLAPLGIRSEDWDPQFANAFMDTRIIFGFDGPPVSLPRQPRLAVEAGSTFLFVAKVDCPTPRIPDGEGIGWIGDGNREGYGQVILWHPFHHERRAPQEGGQA